MIIFLCCYQMFTFCLKFTVPVLSNTDIVPSEWVQVRCNSKHKVKFCKVKTVLIFSATFSNSVTKWGQTKFFSSLKHLVHPVASYPPALPRMTLTKPECGHITPRTHWHRLKSASGSVCAAKPRIILLTCRADRGGANGPVQTVLAVAVLFGTPRRPTLCHSSVLTVL